MKNYFFKFLKKSFLTGAILALFFVNSFSFLTHADDTLFSIEGMNMSQSNGGGTSGDLEAILTRLAERGLLGGGGTGTGGVGGNGVYGGDGTTFNYAERENSNSNNIQADSTYTSALQNQINTFQSSGSYTQVVPVDLDNNGLDEIIVIDNAGKLIIYEWNGTSFKQVQFYGFDETTASQTYFLRIEDENGNQVYYLILYSPTTTTNTNSGDIVYAVGYSWSSCSSPNCPWERSTLYFPSYNNFGGILNDANINNSFSNGRWVCMEVRVTDNGVTYSDRFKSHCGRTGWICTGNDCETNVNKLRGGASKTISNDICSLTRGGNGRTNSNGSKTFRNLSNGLAARTFRANTQGELRLTMGTTMQHATKDSYTLYAKKTGSSSSAFSESNLRYPVTRGIGGNQIRCNSVRTYSIYDYLRAGNKDENYGFINGKFYFTSDDGVKEVYIRKGSSQTIGGRPIYRFVKNSESSGKITFATATTTEKKPQQNGSTIATSEYDTFVTKANSDGTYNYKITLENPEGEQVVAFYGLNFNGIIFKDINGDGVKDIMTYEDYVSEDNIKFKRVYEFIFDPSDYIYKKVLDGVDALEYKWFDVNDDGNLDILIRRYDQKLYLYRNNNLEDVFTNLGAIRGKYFLFSDLIHNGKHQIITKNMGNNNVAGEWKIYNVDGDGYFNTTGNYENGLIGQNYKTFDVDGNTNKLIGILKDTNKYKIVYYNEVTGFFENFPIEFYIHDLTNSYIINGKLGAITFLNKDGNYISFYKNTETGKYIQTEIYYLENGITLRATEGAEVGSTYRLGSGEDDIYYIAGSKIDIQNKINEGFDGGHIITTRVNDISGLFQNNTTFNDDINSWDIQHITNLSNVFNGATSFNKSINSWNTSNVTNMTGLFQGATSYNQSISNWNVSNVSNISNMFNGASSYNQNISSKVFFNGILTHTWTGYDTGTSSWATSNKPHLKTILTKSNGVTKYITDTSMSDGVYNVNGTTYYVVSTKAQIQSYIGGTDISKSPYIITTKVTDMSSLFWSGSDMGYRSGSRSRGPGDMRTPQCNNRNIPNANNTRRIRESRSGTPSLYLTFNGDISTWDTSNVTTMENMFRQNHCFNQDITKWDTSNVTNMNNMFTTGSNLNAPINKNLSGWNVQKVGANHSGFRCNGCTQPTWSA